MTTYDREVDINWFRLLTTHFTHASWGHLLGNVTAFSLVVWHFKFKGHDVLLTLMLTVVLVSIWVMGMDMDITSHMGLSAVVYGLLGLASGDLWRQSRHHEFVVLILGVTAYLLWSWQHHSGVFVAAHWLGLGSGWLVCGMQAKWHHQYSPKRSEMS